MASPRRSCVNTMIEESGSTSCITYLNAYISPPKKKFIRVAASLEGLSRVSHEGLRKGTTTSTSVPGFAFFSRTSPLNSLIRWRMPPIPTPRLPGLNSATSDSTPLPSSCTVMANWLSRWTRATQTRCAFACRRTLVRHS